jgi:hypothetical protein
MEHPHHRWLRRLGDDLQDEYEDIQAELGGHPEKIQESGHRAETAWIALLLERWLPPNYGIATSRYLLFEQEVDGHDRSGEIDLVIFHPAYPTELPGRSSVGVGSAVPKASAGVAHPSTRRGRWLTFAATELSASWVSVDRSAFLCRYWWQLNRFASQAGRPFGRPTRRVMWRWAMTIAR